MKEFKIFEYPEGRHEAVKQDWSWPGFFFGPIWALVKKMWCLGAGLLVAVIVLAIFPVDTAIGGLATLISLGICRLRHQWQPLAREAPFKPWL